MRPYASPPPVRCELCILFLERKRIKKNFGAKLRFAGFFFPFLRSGGLVRQEGAFRRPGGEFLFGRPKRNQKTARGKLRMGTSVPIFALPRTGVSPEKFSRISGAQNLSGQLNSSRATGPWVCKNFRWCGSTTAPGLAEQTFPVRILAGAPRTFPTQTEKTFLKPAGERLAPPAVPGYGGPASVRPLR